MYRSIVKVADRIDKIFWELTTNLEVAKNAFKIKISPIGMNF